MFWELLFRVCSFFYLVKMMPPHLRIFSLISILEFLLCSLSICLSSFYPTQFRQNKGLGYQSKSAFVLYIPHSSDKTNSSGRKDTKSIRLYIPHSSDKTKLTKMLPVFRTLYPTQFRQNLMLVFLSRTCLLLYIPHSSDKTQMS